MIHSLKFSRHASDSQLWNGILYCVPGYNAKQYKGQAFCCLIHVCGCTTDNANDLFGILYCVPGYNAKQYKGHAFCRFIHVYSCATDNANDLFVLYTYFFIYF